jgi:ribosomal protein L40E
MKCKQCGTENPEEARFCMECGMELEKEAETCPSCGTLNPPNSKFCNECGISLIEKEEPQKKSESTEIPRKPPFEIHEVEDDDDSEPSDEASEADKIDGGTPVETKQVEYIPPTGSESWRELCPACNHAPLTPKTYKGILSTTNLLECDYCGAVFEEKGSKYKFKAIYDISSEFWKRYGRKTLTEGEWTRITHGGISDEEKQILEQKASQDDLVSFVNKLNSGTGNLSVIPNPPIILKKGEEACVVLSGVNLLEPRAVRQTRGGYAGPTIRVAKGVSFRMGSVSARSESHEELRKIDQGTFVLTNKRMIFIGAKRTTNIDLRKIISITAYKDGIASQRENKQKTEYFTALDRHSVTFTINGRTHSVPFTGLIMKAAVEGKIRQI